MTQLRTVLEEKLRQAANGSTIQELTTRLAIYDELDSIHCKLNSQEPYDSHTALQIARAKARLVNWEV